jgi:outer membrane protein TolC
MKVIHKLTFILLLYLSQVQAQKTFSTFDEVLDYAKSKNISLQQGDIKMTQAKKAKLAAIVGVVDPTGTNTFSYTNNTRIPVQVIGGQAIETGVQYVTNFSQNIELKLLNFSGWENLKLAKINIQTTEIDNKINLKTIYENIASTYYNVVNLQEQIIATEDNFKAADILLKTAENRYKQGIVKQQDVNDSKASYLTTKENIEQLKLLLQQNYLTLKILADIPENEIITINQTIEKKVANTQPEIVLNDLKVSSTMLKEKYAYSNYRQSAKTQWPTVSLFYNNANNQFNTQSTFLDSDVDWIKSSYIGVKLSMSLPSASSVSQKFKAKYDYELAQKDTEHAKIKADLDFKQLRVDFDKAFSQAKSNNEIYILRKDTYDKNQNLYTEGLLGIDQTINSFNTMVNSKYSMVSSNINVLLAQSKIDINNKIK